MKEAEGKPVLRGLAADVERAVQIRMRRGEPGGTTGTALASGEGWAIYDVVCTSGPDDRPFEERHSGARIGMVLAGTFQYRTGQTNAMLTPGSLLLGNEGECFECSHRHATGDRCVAFHYTSHYFERIAFDAGGPSAGDMFRVGRLAPHRELSLVGAQAAAGLLGATAGWEELSVELAAVALRLANGQSGSDAVPLGAESSVTASVRAIERDPAAPHSLAKLAGEARLSPYHYLRTFQRVTGVTPHQFILRTRLREAALRLAMQGSKVIEVGLDVGFNDLSSFNRIFRAEFGMSPRQFRRASI
jgi:AraC family transcriptional regulator